MKKVWELWHEWEDEYHNWHDKFLGLFSSQQKARQARNIFKTRDYFISHPGNFDINSSQVDGINWPSGFFQFWSDQED